MKSQRGAVQVLVIILVAASALLFAPSLKLPAFLQKKPPVAQLSTAEIELAKARAAQADAEAKLATAQAAEKAKQDAQYDYAQQFASGVPLALAKVPVEHQTPEVKLAAELSQRAIAGLNAARGKLPDAAQAEIQKLVDQALSAVTAERDAYRAQISVKDAQLADATQQRMSLEKTIPTLEASVTTTKAEVAVKDAEVQTKTKEVADWAQKKADADAKAGSLDHYAGTLARILIAFGVLYFVAHWLIPCLAQSYPSAGWLTKISSFVKNASTSHV